MSREALELPAGQQEVLHTILVVEDDEAIEGLETVPTLMMSAQVPSREALHRRQISFLKKPFDLAMLLKLTATLLVQQNNPQ